MEKEMLNLEALSTTERLFYDEFRLFGEGQLIQLDIEVRRTIVGMIDRLSKSRRDLDAFEPYLAMTYFDRFWMKEHTLTEIREGMSFLQTAKIYAMAFMSIACKMRKSRFYVDDFSAVDGSSYWNVDKIAFLDTETHILNALDWKLKPLTSFSFMDYFSPLFKLVDNGIRHREVSRIIVKFKGDSRFIRYKPSIIAASALFFVAESIMPNERLDEIRMEISMGRKNSPESYLEELIECQRQMAESFNLEELFPLIPRVSCTAETITDGPPLFSMDIPEFDIVEVEEQMTPRTISKGKWKVNEESRAADTVENVDWPIVATDDDDLLMEFRINWPKVTVEQAVVVDGAGSRKSTMETVMDCFVKCCNYICKPWKKRNNSS